MKKDTRICECGHKRSSHNTKDGHCKECDEDRAFTCGTMECNKFVPEKEPKNVNKDT